MKTAIWALALAMSIGPASWAGESADSWGNLKRLHVGQKIVVINMNWILTEGRFVAVSDDAISVRKGQSVVQISRGDVLQVGKQKSRWRKVGIAAVIAGVASGGFFLPFAIGAGESAAFIATGIISAGTAGIGGAVGASLPPGYRAIYSAKLGPSGVHRNSTEEQTEQPPASDRTQPDAPE